MSPAEWNHFAGCVCATWNLAPEWPSTQRMLRAWRSSWLHFAPAVMHAAVAQLVEEGHHKCPTSPKMQAAINAVRKSAKPRRRVVRAAIALTADEHRHVAAQLEDIAQHHTQCANLRRVLEDMAATQRRNAERVDQGQPTKRTDLKPLVKAVAG